MREEKAVAGGYLVSMLEGARLQCSLELTFHILTGGSLSMKIQCFGGFHTNVPDLQNKTPKKGLTWEDLRDWGPRWVPFRENRCRALRSIGW